jgi:S-formylglutathione hydrolase FrmB
VVLLCVTGIAQAAGPASTPPLAVCTPVDAPAAAPALQLLSTTTISPRLTEFEFSTPYLPAATRVRILTPVGYNDSPERRWPLLLLLHGTGGDQTDWTVKGDAEALTEHANFITVMPQAGSGLYADAYGVAGEGGPRWESYHLRQLLPWVDAHYRTITNRAGRAIAGLSMGGGGTMNYAARHPDLFSFAHSFSGAVDPTNPGLAGPVPVRATDINQALLVEDSQAPESAFGPWATEEVRTRAHSAADMAGNLRHTVIALRVGNGENEQGVITDAEEFGVHSQNISLHQALARAGIRHTFDDYGPGTHTWDYFTRDFRLMIAPLTAYFAKGKNGVPASFSYTTAEERADVYGYRVTSDRGFMEFSTMDASQSRLSISGSGIFHVTTSPRYTPNATYLLTATRNGTSQDASLRADSLGRLSFCLDTGVRSSGQQFRLSSDTEINGVELSIRPE